LIAQYGLSVMSLGGFLGRDNTISVSKFADLVESGEVRYVLASGGIGAAPRGNFFARGVLPGGGGRSFGNPPAIGGAATSGPSAVLAAVARTCTPVSGPTLPAADRGSLYDCSGSAAALRGGTVASNTTL
jgi:hypothetical protein